MSDSKSMGGPFQNATDTPCSKKAQLFLLSLGINPRCNWYDWFSPQVLWTLEIFMVAPRLSDNKLFLTSTSIFDPKQ